MFSSAAGEILNQSKKYTKEIKDLREKNQGGANQDKIQNKMQLYKAYYLYSSTLHKEKSRNIDSQIDELENEIKGLIKKTQPRTYQTAINSSISSEEDLNDSFIKNDTKEDVKKIGTVLLLHTPKKSSFLHKINPFKRSANRNSNYISK